MMDIALLMLGGLSLFLFAVHSLSESIRDAVGKRSEEWVKKFTGNIFSSILTGTVITFLLDSSSAVIIITIVMVNAGILNLRQAMGIVLGANIGTTFSSQIIALDLGMYAPLFMATGLFMMFFSKLSDVSKYGKIIFFFGLLFFGLYTMEKSVEPLRHHPYFTSFMHSLNNHWQGTLAGMIITLVIQSSSATVGMAIILVKKGLLSLTGGIALMMGAELGTVSDTLLATIRGTRQAIKTGIFHLFFNLVTVFIGLWFFDPFSQLVIWFSQGASPERTLANAHMLFNILGVLLLGGFIPLFEKGLNRLIPDQSSRADRAAFT